ncbi:hypothetical protein GUITHDRAFT_90026 [Guillardia theta CCMP2712]|uniref:Radical SAM core domain-containing protein n=1 Tax=Guillardia theta (strain CCMP2712) TaxID=905079 RepID=L1IK87_GUITC|nr:hypothetical protein GUITHDRAFT_90026 [Guillardia theta CCMP2712]EKX36319.1 hypothetical protein GUITHDRAFT_90026 [Guillardia theta CCMP2712]|eukprot:XP_005823299.1 hypothetical protein GUITHDRAFT_90026 [Guillardia theta CCMP2712]
MRMVVAADAIDADALVQTPRPSVFEHLPDLGELLGGTGKAKLVWASIRAGRDPWTDETVTEKARKKLKENFQEIPRVSHVTRASCGTIKLLIAMQDGMEIESVVIPHEGRPTAASVVEPRTTLCVSSQVGCNRACSFCATGKMGFIRQLTSHEILSQVYIALRCIKEENLPPLHNIVFMGMGEPLNNFVNACEVLTDQNCFQMAKNRVTVSSVGPSPAVIRAAAGIPAMLAWSVHAADDTTRSKLVPTTANTMVELRDQGERMTSVAVTLIDGINDSVEQADQLMKLLTPLLEQGPALMPAESLLRFHVLAGLKVCVDLIPYNDIGTEDCTPPADVHLQVPAAHHERGFACFVRVTRGDDQSAACGQLATSSKSSRKQS